MMNPLARSASLLLPALLLAAGTLAAQQSGRYGHYDVYDADYLPREEFATRRAAVLMQLDKTSAMLICSAEEQNRSNDVDYLYRQRSNLLYLTGVTEAESALLLVPKGITVGGRKVTELLFVKERDPAKEIWEGVSMGPEVAAQVTGITAVMPYDRLDSVLDRVLPGLATVYYDNWLHETAREPLSGTVYQWRSEMEKDLARRFPDLTVKNAGAIVNELRRVKSAAEIVQMRRAIDMSIAGHRAAMTGAKPGMYEYELAALMEYQFRRLGSEYPGYPSIVGSGPNSCILHYESDRRQTKAGELVLMDCGAEYHGYSADVTRTFPVSGRFSPEQRLIYDLVLKAQDSGIAACRVGNNFFDPHRKAANIIAEGLVRLGIIGKPADSRKYFPHGTSHYLGIDVHDVGQMGTLKPGSVLTVEPGIYIPAGSPCDPKWWNIGIRIEDDILVTGSVPVNLSGALERKADDIERLMRAGGN
ncbi:MAG: secreted Xaa-Pro aminopeptidase [Chlorobi bacterium]|nr:secreted Xaa-Pro aminopeptidase [Chlorobiota bacterium]